VIVPVVQEKGRTPLLSSAIPIVVPVSSNGSAAMSVGVLHVSPPPRAESGDTGAEGVRPLDTAAAFRDCAERVNENRCSLGEASTTSESPSRARNLPRVFIRRTRLSVLGEAARLRICVPFRFPLPIRRQL
jgi:hypothetical protein